MKLIHAILIACILYLWSLPNVYGSTWTPSVEWVIVVMPEEPFFTCYQETAHFRWQWGDGKQHPVERIGEAERLVVYAMGGQERPVATPEPGTAVLLASGLGMLIWRRKWNTR